MAKHQKLLTLNRIKDLADRLSKIPSVRQFDQADEPQGWTIAHALSHLENSFSVVLDVLLPQLAEDKTKSADELNDLVLDVGEELRHMLYHIRDVRYFGYLFNGDEEQPKPTRDNVPGDRNAT